MAGNVPYVSQISNDILSVHSALSEKVCSNFWQRSLEVDVPFAKFFEFILLIDVD